MTKSPRRLAGSGTDPNPHASTASATPAGTDVVIQVKPGGLLALLTIGLVVLVAALWHVGAVRLPAVPEVNESASLWLVFLTGLTAGGLSCLAVQGGLLATTIGQREQRLIESHIEDRVKATEHVAPILLFLSAKLVAYTLLGALLGFFGSFISLTPALRGVVQIAIGVFMLGVALQMLNVHPVFRYFGLQPPRAAQRLIRRHSKRGDSVAPLALGALTVLIPCGITQAMQLVAIASGSPMRGALIMFAFVLGTSPVFFLLGLLATRLSSTLHGAFLKLAAVAVGALALLSIQTGFRLLPLSSTAVSSPVPGQIASAAAPSEAQNVTASQYATINVLATGYQPPALQIKSGAPATISLVTDNIYGCTRAFVIPSLGVQKILPATGTETIDIPASQPGQIAYTCGMGMYGGVIEVVQ